MSLIATAAVATIVTAALHEASREMLKQAAKKVGKKVGDALVNGLWEKYIAPTKGEKDAKVDNTASAATGATIPGCSSNPKTEGPNTETSAKSSDIPEPAAPVTPPIEKPQATEATAVGSEDKKDIIKQDGLRAPASAAQKEPSKEGPTFFNPARSNTTPPAAAAAAALASVVPKPPAVAAPAA